MCKGARRTTARGGNQRDSFRFLGLATDLSTTSAFGKFEEKNGNSPAVHLTTFVNIVHADGSGAAGLTRRGLRDRQGRWLCRCLGLFGRRAPNWGRQARPRRPRRDEKRQRCPGDGRSAQRGLARRHRRPQVRLAQVEAASPSQTTLRVDAVEAHGSRAIGGVRGGNLDLRGGGNEAEETEDRQETTGKHFGSFA